MFLTYTQIRQIKHLAVDFRIEYGANVLNELRMNPLTGLPEFDLVGESDIGLKRLYFTYTGDDGSCDQFQLNNVEDALAAVSVVASIYHKINYCPTKLIRSFYTVGNHELALIKQLDDDFILRIVETYSKDIGLNSQLGATYVEGFNDPDYVDIYLTYNKTAGIQLELQIVEIASNEILDSIVTLAVTYNEIIDTPLEMAKHF